MRKRSHFFAELDDLCNDIENKTKSAIRDARIKAKNNAAQAKSFYTLVSQETLNIMKLEEKMKAGN